MSEQTSAIVSKVWALCNPLRDDGVSYGDYLEQLTYLIFLKMSNEYSQPPYKRVRLDTERPVRGLGEPQQASGDIRKGYRRSLLAHKFQG